MKVFKEIQNSTIFVEGEGSFTQEGVVFAANGANNITMSQNGDEIFEESFVDIEDEDGNSVGTTQAEVLSYLNDQKIAVRVSAVWGNSDTTTNLNTGTSFTSQFVPILGNELKQSELFTKIDENIFEVQFYGEICICVNIHLTSAGERNAMQSKLVRNPSTTSNVVGPTCSTGYIRNLNGHAETSLNYTYVSGVSVGDRFAIGIRRESTNTTDCTMVNTNSSQLQVMRLR